MRLTVPVRWRNRRINKAEHPDQPAKHIYTRFNLDSHLSADFPKQQIEPRAWFWHWITCCQDQSIIVTGNCSSVSIKRHQCHILSDSMVSEGEGNSDVTFQVFILVLSLSRCQCRFLKRHICFAFCFLVQIVVEPWRIFWKPFWQNKADDHISSRLLWGLLTGWTQRQYWDSIKSAIKSHVSVITNINNHYLMF